MNSRDLALVSSSAIFGALISALAFRFFSSNPKNPKSRRVNSTEITAISRNFSALDPFSPLKRNGFVTIPLNSSTLAPISLFHSQIFQLSEDYKFNLLLILMLDFVGLIKVLIMG